MQTVEEFPLHPAEADQWNGEPSSEKVIFRPFSLDDHGFNRAIQDVTLATVTVYHPPPEKNNGTALVVCPGGGYGVVVIDREGHWPARFFQKLGFIVIVLKYRLPRPRITDGDPLPLSQRDALDALRYVRRNAAVWGARRVGIWGASAGGHLAASTAFFGGMEDASQPDFVALLYPVVCMGPPYSNRDTRDALLGREVSSARLAAFSLERQVRANLPPFFIVHAADDLVVPVENSRLLTAALREKNVPVSLVEYTEGGHGFSLGLSPDHETATWKDAFINWLRLLP
ncbi:esterase/lipase [Opitutaceae bacterium TAV1]|nr:esterase/lipase [Opitutaceae bacterium TAV1]